jgi:hypothetical protein
VKLIRTIVRVRIQWKTKTPAIAGPFDRLAALVLAALLAPAALIAFTMAGWRIATDLRWISRFAWGTGVFPRWQAWLTTAVILLISVSVLDRYGSKEIQ